MGIDVVTTRATPRAVAQSADTDWWRGAVIYQIYPRSFQDSNGDGVGDLTGITTRLPYVADLGVDAIWISPFFASPMGDFGYDVSDYRAVDPLFGTLADFDRLIDKAHSLGLKVIIDQVISHTSDRHPWFGDSRANRTNDRANWYVWADARDDGTPPNNWLSLFGGPAWEWDTRREQYYLHNFLSSQPDLNFHEPEVQDALLADMRFWLDRGVDGFRLDTVNFYFHSAGLEDNPPAKDRNAPEAPAVNPYNYQDHLYDKSQPENLAFLQRLRSLLDEYPGSTSVGEIGDAQRSLQTLAAYTSGGDKLHMSYTFGFLSPNFGRAHFTRQVEEFERLAGDGWPCWAFSNHDITRHISRWGKFAGARDGASGDVDRFAKLTAALLLSLRGSVCLYQGEELGMVEADLDYGDITDPYGKRFWPEYKGRDGCRTPMVWVTQSDFGGFSENKPWLPVPATHLERAVDRQAADEHSVLAQYRRFLAFRTMHPALRNGAIAVLASDGDVLAVVRGEGRGRIVAVFNLAPAVAHWTPPDGWGLTPLGGHGFCGHIEGGRVALGGHDAFFATIDGSP